LEFESSLEIDEQMAIKISTKFPGLESLDLGNNKMGVGGLNYFADHCKDLKKLKLFLKPENFGGFEVRIFLEISCKKYFFSDDNQKFGSCCFKNRNRR
jgi:hypothetical protein